MATTLHSEIEIQATPERVWDVLTAFDAFPDWNPFIRRISGEPVQGFRLEAHIQPAGGRAMTFRPTVLAADPGRELRWLGHLGIPGLFDGEHIFRIEPTGPNRVRFVQEERFRGLLVPLLLRFIARGTEQGFAAMNQRLKDRAEQDRTGAH